MDTSKHVFQLHGVNAGEEPFTQDVTAQDVTAQDVTAQDVTAQDVEAFFAKRPPAVAIEACGGAHPWARQLQSLGHAAKMLAPQDVKPNVKRGKNDAADAEALGAAVSRRCASCRFVPLRAASCR